MKRNNLDPKVLDYTWKQNRLSKDREALKNSMLDVIRKKPKIQHATQQNSIMPRESGIANNTGMGYGVGGQGGTANNATMMGM